MSKKKNKEEPEEEKESNEPPFEFVCPICGKEFSIRVLFIGHMRSHEV